MRLSYQPPLSEVDRELLKPKPGDVVWFESQRYVVVQMGLRWLTMHKEGEDPNRLYTAKVGQIIKDVPETQEEEQDANERPGEYQPNN